ncbi:MULTISPECIES: DUF3626 domain-containing protein [unclassified Microbacterium]|uniref:DUF3626 domain-containing protein n=1 Tax=unclassified Microbacterium TaxID=2609290 RepID=UPI0012FA7788|nr:DUF3626 domain-containing protein [Microbacterium sp. MAH-37]MVQ41029.1 DUF3626 domain-containing protein [Microbacterium sp. MAH-37]
MPTTVALHFHPNWPFQGGSVIEAMAEAGRYRSQFETATSNGGLTAHPGGDRWRWESRLFAGRYDGRPAEERPVYGAVVGEDAYGPATRFGSAHLRLRPEVTARTTFCYPDSVFEPDGVVEEDGADALVARMRADDLDLLDRYVEAHVHGGIRFAVDVEAVVLDPCFRGTAVQDAAEHLGCAVEFHPGFLVRTEDLDEEYRGPEPLRLARELGVELTPEVVGAAVRSGRHDPQTLKRVWHLLARYGRVGIPVS